MVAISAHLPAQELLFGVNIPWWGGSYCHDLGRNARYPGWSVWYRGDEISRTLRWLRTSGIEIIRLWLFEAAEGLLYDSEGFVIGLDSEFQRNLEDLVARIEAADLRVYWTLLDANSVYRSNDMITLMILSKQECALQFLKYALTPIAPLLRKVAWGFDLCNEPEAIITGNCGNWTSCGVSWAIVREPLLAIRVASTRLWPDMPISIGSGWHECKNLRSGVYERLSLNLDFYDFHDQRNIPYISGQADVAINSKVVVGELGIGGNPAMPVSRDEWRVAQATLAKKVECLRYSNYKAVFLWYLSDWNSQDVGGLIYRGEVSSALHCIAHYNNSIVPKF